MLGKREGPVWQDEKQQSVEHRIRPSQTSGKNENVPSLLVALFRFIFSFFHLPSLSRADRLERIPLTGIRRQTARSQGRKNGAYVAPCVWIPRWSPLGEASPRALCQLQSTTKLLGRTGHFGGREGSPIQLRHCSLTQRILSELLAGRAPHRFYSGFVP